MAIDEAIITNFIATAGLHYTSELPKYLECSICTNMLQDPVCCESGAHTFCRKCLNDWSLRSLRPVCPIDREELGRGEDRPRRAPRALQECIDALEVLCALGCGWTGPQANWPDHLRRDCPEVEGDDDENRQRRAGSIPLAIRAHREQEEANARALLAAQEMEAVAVDAVAAPAVDEEIDALLALIDKRTGAVCDACHSDIFNEGYMCVSCPDHDICAECWLDGARTTHDSTHSFVKLRSREDWFPGEGNDRLHGILRDAARNLNVHRGITCDGCTTENIKGVRYQCNVCEDFDLCEACVGQNRRMGRHTKDHDMLRISKPQRQG